MKINAMFICYLYTITESRGLMDNTSSYSGDLEFRSLLGSGFPQALQANTAIAGLY
jgi:hypothetical protein